MVSPDYTSDALDSSAPTPRLEPRASFMELGQLVVGEQPLSQVLTRIAELAQACVPGRQDVSVTLIEDDGRATTVGFTGPLAATLDERQYEHGFGPCLDAAKTSQTIRIDDTTSDNPYKEFTDIAARQGVRSMVSVGVPMPHHLVGGLNVYVYDETPLSDDAVEVLNIFGGYAAVAMANHSLYATSFSLNGHLQTAMKSRAVIEQAKGVLMAELRCSADEAFAVMSERSQKTNRKLHDVATDITTLVQGR